MRILFQITLFCLQAWELRLIQIREGAKVRDDKKKLDQLVTEIFVINSISTVVAYICLFICSSLPVFKNYQELILLNGTIMIFDLIGVNWLFNIFEDYIYITVRTLAFQIISLVLLFVFVQTPEDYLIYAGLIVFANAGANIFNIFYGRKYVSFFKCSKLNLKKHLKPIFIIFGIGIASQIYLNIDTTMLGLLKSDYDVGLYSAAIKINRTLGTLISSACAVLIPRLSYYIKMKMEKEYRNIVNTTVNYILSLSIPCAFGCALLSSECIFLFSGKGFEGCCTDYAYIVSKHYFCSDEWILGIPDFYTIWKRIIYMYCNICGRHFECGIKFYFYNNVWNQRSSSCNSSGRN